MLWNSYKFHRRGGNTIRMYVKYFSISNIIYSTYQIIKHFKNYKCKIYGLLLCLTFKNLLYISGFMAPQLISSISLPITFYDIQLY